MPEWLAPYEDVLLLLGTVSLISLALSALVVPVIAVRIRADYFASRRRRRPPLTVPRLIAVGFRNLLGAVFVLAGIAMLLLPGQGVLTILIGVLIMDFPGKYRFERWLVGLPAVLRSLNWIRDKTGKPPLMVAE